MSRLKSIGQRFRTTFVTVEGKRLRGQLLENPDTSRVSNFLSPRRFLRTSVPNPVTAGEIVIANGVYFIVSFHGDGFHLDDAIYSHFKLFEVDKISKWYSHGTYLDPVTGQEIGREDLIPQTVYLSTNPDSYERDSVKIPNKRIEAVCNSEVKVEDRIDNFIVTKVDKVLGVYLVELKEV